MTLRHRIRFYQQLAVLMRAGVPLRGSLERMQQKMREKQLRVLSQRVNEGERIGDAFVAAGFSPFECHLVVAGERSGQLHTIFEHLSEHWTRELHLRQALVRPLIYPIFVMHLVILVSSGIELLQHAWPVVVVHFIWRLVTFYLAGFLIYIAAKVTWSSESLRHLWYWVPLVGGLLKRTYAYRWITALRMEFTSGVSLYRAVGDAWRASGYAGSERYAAEGEEAMQHGAQLSNLMQGWTQLPRDWIDFIETGEMSGKLEESFKGLEAEAAHAYKIAQDRMNDWAPKILYFVALLYVGSQIVAVGKTLYVDPINDAIKQIDDAGK